MIKMRCTKQSQQSGEGVQNNAESDDQNETPKALLNDVVLQNIFKYLGYKDLKACREVGNKTWLKNCKKAWWSRTIVVFSLDDGGLDKTKEYLKHVDITSNVTNYRLEYITIEPEEDLEDSNDSEDLEEIKDSKYFWNKLGPSIKHLELFYVSFPTANVFWNIINKKCPNLEKLVVENLNIEENDDLDDESLEFKKPRFGEHKNLKFLEFALVNSIPPRNMPVSWIELLSHFPKLQGLKVDAHYEEVYKKIAIIRKHDSEMLKLKHIDMFCQVEDDYEQSLRSVLLDPNLSLETIRIKVANCKLDTITEILELHGKSLKELQIYDGFYTAETLSIPQPLKKLETLEISCDFTPEIFKYTPNVRKVEVILTELFYDSLEVEPNLKVDTCKELTLHSGGLWEDESNSKLTFFQKLFPNVETLKISDTNNLTFSMICERWTKLASFKINESEVNAVGLLGFDPDSKDEDRIRSPNITNLKDLRSFSMSAHKRLEMKNGDLILNALKELKHLQEFELIGYQTFKKDEKFWKEISAKYRLVMEDEDFDSD